MVTQGALRQTWTTVLTTTAAKLGTQKRVNALFPNAANANICQITIPKEETHQYVAMDQGRVATFNEKPLYSEQFGSCLAILSRAFKSKETSVSHLSLNHIYLTPAKFKQTLTELVNKIEKAGVVEIFISGGTRETREDLQQIQAIISETKKEFPNVSFLEKSSTFGIANHEYYLFDDQKRVHQGSCGIAYAGFDQAGNPYQIIDVAHPSFKANLGDNPYVRWMKV